jgi:probable addiction module antidote protein
MAAYLEAALDEGDPALAAAAMGDIARKRNNANRSRNRSRTREPLQGSSPEGNPEVATVVKVLLALGLQLYATAVQS